MDAITAVGLAGSIVQFLDFGSEVVKRLREFTSHAGGGPKTFRDVNNGLQLLLHSIERIQQDLKENTVDDKTKAALFPVIQGCIEQAELLNKILKDILPAPGDSQWKKFNKALSSISYDKKVEKIQSILKEYRGGLVLYQTVSPSSRSDASPDWRRPSITQVISIPDFGDQPLSYSLTLHKVPGASSIGSPTETIFDSSWSTGSASPAFTDITISRATPNIQPSLEYTATTKQPPLTEEPSQTERPLEDTPLFIPEPAIGHPQKIIKAEM